jgi:hypothetical protein
MISPSVKSDRIVWLSGVSTRGIADDEQHTFDGWFGWDGTKSYTTVTGAAKTVRRLRALPLDVEKIASAYRARCTELVALQPPVAKPIRKALHHAPVDKDREYKAMLTNARNLAKAGLPDAARKNLKRILKEAPGTSIAKEAQQELDQLESGH